jgi:hypothetical protein
MIETTLCGYCIELPQQSRAAAIQVSRCPLCKTNLGVSRHGQHFRLGVEVARARRIWPLAVLVGFGACASLAFLTWIITGPEPARIIVVLPPPPAPVVEQGTTDGAPASAVPANVSEAKPLAEGGHSPNPRAKPPAEPLAPLPMTADAVRKLPLASSVAYQAPTVPAGTQAATMTPKVSEVEARDHKELLSVPEVALEPKPANQAARPLDKDSNATSRRAPMVLERTAARARIAELAREIEAANRKEPDGFIRSLQAGSTDIAGLPFRLGNDCRLPSEQVRLLAQTALAVRGALAHALKSNASPRPSDGAALRWVFWEELQQTVYKNGRQALCTDWPTAAVLLSPLQQILAAEDPGLRIGLVDLYRHFKTPEATAALLRLALYDAEPAVREEALSALPERPEDQCTDALLTALRYPWTPLVQRAADALVDLRRADLVPQLIDLLDQPDPDAPFEQESQGKKTTVVRELVKINHHRNCLLCHAPASARIENRLVAPVPSPAESLSPNASVVYYAERSGITLVRADVTYLRQDFSMMMSVDDAGAWPQMQRFDFVVRTRTLSDAEVLDWKAKLDTTAPPPVSAYRHAIVSALRQLTNLDAGLTAASWRAALDSAARTHSVRYSGTGKK